MSSLSFKKEEHLKSRKIIGNLFKEGNSFISFPLRLVWLKMDSPKNDFPIQMALTVPKRAFPKAIDRNQLRRRIREAFRLNKHFLYNKMEGQKDQFALMIIYIAKETLEYKAIEKGMIKGMNRLVQVLKKEIV